MDPETKPDRRLAAIMATDVVGYSRLMQSDETGALAALAEVRQVTEKQIRQHRGRIANTAGDSVLAEFTSAVAAVSCAMIIQELLTQTGQARCFQVRMGIHIGDVVDRDGDLFGTAVNIAARLEALAEPGGIVVSSSVREDVAGKIPASFTDLGKKPLKNISEPMRVFSVNALTGGSAVAIREADRRIRLTHDGSISIAVLPFANLSNDPEQEFIADGLTDDLITELSRLRDYLVIARNTVFTYKGKPVDVSQIGRELGVRYVLEGSVRRLGQRVRITAQLIRADNASHLWAEKFDRNFEDLFEVQDEVVRAVVASTHTRLLINEGTFVERLSGANADYWELAKRGMAAGWNFTPEGLNEAVRIGTHLTDEFPTLARGHQILAEALFMQIILGYQPSTSELKDRVVRAAQEAVRLDPSDEHCLFVQGMVLTLLLGQPEEGIILFQRILSINPNFVSAHGLLGNAYCRVGQPDKAIEHVEMAVRLDPRDPSVCFRYSTLAEAYFFKQEHQHSLHWARQAIALKPDYWLPHAVAAAACVETGDAQNSQRFAQSLLTTLPDGTVSQIKEVSYYPEKVWERFSQALLTAGIPA